MLHGSTFIRLEAPKETHSWKCESFLDTAHDGGQTGQAILYNPVMLRFEDFWSRKCRMVTNEDGDTS